MEDLEFAIKTACEDGTLPGAVLQAINTDGSFKYSKAFGVLSIGEDKGKSTLLPVDAIFWLASCTKLMTSIAALQCVDRGQINLDDDVTGIIPEIANLDILTGFDDDGKPILNKRQNKITLRVLLSHSSGMGYKNFRPELREYVAAIGDQSIGTGKTVVSRYGAVPLMFEPGSGWMYGTGIDWAGQVVERLNGNTSLEDYMKKNIWSPLGIEDITFWPAKRPGMRERMAGMTERTLNGQLLPSEPKDGREFKDCFGGGEAYASMPDFLRILHSLLSDDERLLKKETTKQMMTPQLGKEAQESFQNHLTGPFRLFIGEFPDSQLLDYGLGGMIVMSDEQYWRGKGTFTWGGWPNIFWYIDRMNGLCGIFGTQVAPPGDTAVTKLITLFEKTMQYRAKSR